jgi:hypothetical protein
MQTDVIAFGCIKSKLEDYQGQTRQNTIVSFGWCFGLAFLILG